MEFNNLKEYIEQVYKKRVDAKFLEKNAPSLTYLKLVRTLALCRISTVGMTAEDLFSEACRAERMNGMTEQAFHQYALADLHEIVEGLLRQAGHELDDRFDRLDSEAYSDAINS